MHAPVSMLKGFGGKESTSLVLTFLLGLAVLAMVNRAKAPTTTPHKPTA